MAKYRVNFETVASTYVEVEAANEEDALEKAYERGQSSICAQCSGWGQDPGIELGEWETPSNMPWHNEQYGSKDVEEVS